MTHERLVMKLTWGPRKEDVGECAQRLKRCLVGLGKVHPVFAKWFEDKASEAGRRFNIAPRLADLRETLRASLRRTEDDRTLPALGHRASFWAGAGDTRCIATFDVFCGAYGRGATNGCSLNLFATEDCAAEMLTVTRLTELFRLAVTCWEPSRGLMGFLDCEEYLVEHFPDFNALPFKCSWFTLVDGTNGVARRKLGYQQVPLSESKTLLIASDVRFAANRKRHAVAIYRLTRRLN